MAQGTFHYSTYLFLSNADGTTFQRNIELDHPPQHHIVRLQACPVMDKHYTVSVKMLAMTKRRMKIRCDASIWFRDEEVFNVRNEQMMVTGSWVQLGVINLYDELTEEESNASNSDSGILIVPGEEVHDNDNDEFVDHCSRSYMRVSINFVEVKEEEVVTGVIIPRSYVTFAKWGVCTLLGLAIEHALLQLSRDKKRINLNRNELH